MSDIGKTSILKIRIGEASKVYKEKKNRDRKIKIMDKYEHMKRFHHDLQLQVYMYDFMYVDTETITMEDYFPDTKTCVEKYRKISTTGTLPKHWLGFSYICSEDYELDLKFDET